MSSKHTARVLWDFEGGLKAYDKHRRQNNSWLRTQSYTAESVRENCRRPDSSNFSVYFCSQQGFQ